MTFCLQRITSTGKEAAKASISAQSAAKGRRKLKREKVYLRRRPIWGFLVKIARARGTLTNNSKCAHCGVGSRLIQSDLYGSIDKDGNKEDLCMICYGKANSSEQQPEDKNEYYNEGKWDIWALSLSFSLRRKPPTPRLAALAKLHAHTHTPTPPSTPTHTHIQTTTTNNNSNDNNNDVDEYSTNLCTS